MQIALFAVICTSELIGVNPDVCKSDVQKITTIVLLLLIAFACLVVYRRLVSTLESKYNEMYKTHGNKLLSFVVGMVTCILVFAVLITLPKFKLSKADEIIDMILLWIVTIIPIILYSFMVDANEDCFDCFNRL